MRLDAFKNNHIQFVLFKNYFSNNDAICNEIVGHKSDDEIDFDGIYKKTSKQKNEIDTFVFYQRGLPILEHFTEANKIDFSKNLTYQCYRS